MQLTIRLNDVIFKNLQNGMPLELIDSDEVHIDTVKLSHAFDSSDLPTAQELLDRGFNVSLNNRDDNHIAVAYSKPQFSKSNNPRLRIIRSEKKNSYSGISAECSFAKLVNGNGLGEQTVDDIECAFDAIEDYARQRIGVEFDARTAKVNRYDVNVDFRVGEERIGSYLNSISRPDSRLIPSTFGSTTNYYYNQSRTMAIYGKKKEMERLYKQGKATKEDVIAADGLLRIEGRLKTNQVITRFADQHSLCPIGSELLTKDVALKHISNVLTQLRLNKPRMPMKVRNQLLLNHFGKDAAEMLGLLEYRELLGDDFWKELDWSKQKYYRLKNKLIEANLWDVSPTEALPILTVSNTYNNSTSLS